MLSLEGKLSNYSLRARNVTLLLKRTYSNCLLIRQDNSLTAHLTPVHFIQPRPCMTFTMYRTAIGWPARTKSIYKYIQTYIQDNRKEGTAVPKNGDLAADGSMQLSTYIKTSAKEEKFQH